MPTLLEQLGITSGVKEYITAVKDVEIARLQNPPSIVQPAPGAPVYEYEESASSFFSNDNMLLISGGILLAVMVYAVRK